MFCLETMSSCTCEALCCCWQRKMVSVLERCTGSGALQLLWNRRARPRFTCCARTPAASAMVTPAASAMRWLEPDPEAGSVCSAMQSFERARERPGPRVRCIRLARCKVCRWSWNAGGGGKGFADQRATRGETMTNDSTGKLVFTSELLNQAKARTLALLPRTEVPSVLGQVTCTLALVEPAACGRVVSIVRHAAH